MRTGRNLIITVMMSLMAASSSFGQVARVTYSPSQHYSEKVEIFRHEHKIDSTDIVMIGNSLTEYAGNWSVLLGVRHVINRGIAGDDAAGIYNRLSQILPGHPKTIFLMVGINDLAQDATAEQVASWTEKIVMRIRRESPHTRLFVQSILPINESFGVWKNLDGKSDDIQRANRLVHAFMQKHHVDYLNLYPCFIRQGTNVMRKELTQDGVHLTAFGYKVWAFEIRKYICGKPSV